MTTTHLELVEVLRLLDGAREAVLQRARQSNEAKQY